MHFVFSVKKCRIGLDWIRLDGIVFLRCGKLIGLQLNCFGKMKQIVSELFGFLKVLLMHAIT